MDKRKRGSLTVEAVIAFSVFISFMFMLLSMVKISLVKITLENAVSETAKYIASASYPIGMFNDIADDSNKTVKADIAELKIGKDFQTKGVEALYEVLFADSEAKALKSGDSGIDEMFKVFKNAGEDMIKDIVLTGAENIISKGGSKVVGNIVSEIILCVQFINKMYYSIEALYSFIKIVNLKGTAYARNKSFTYNLFCCLCYKNKSTTEHYKRAF